MTRPRRAMNRGSTLAALVPAIVVASLVGYAADANASSAAPQFTSSNQSLVAGAQPPTTSAWAFLNSVGVNVHMQYNTTPYANTGNVVNLLNDLGVRHVRDSSRPGNPRQVLDFEQLGRAGVGLTLIMNGPTRTDTQQVDPRQIAQLNSVRPYLDGVEGPNEYDCSGDPAWATHLHAYDSALASAVQNDSTLNGVPLLGPSFCSRQSLSTYGQLTSPFDVANLHNYAGISIPEMAVEGRTGPFSEVPSSQLPVQVTESGFTDDLSSSREVVARQATSAEYDIRYLLDAYRAGIQRTFIYELFDEHADPNMTNNEDHFGLLDNSGQPKPAYLALRNLLHDVAQGDPNQLTAPTAPVTPSNAEIYGGGSLLRSLAIDDPNDGGQTIALWLAEPLENPTNHQPLPNYSAPVVVTTPSAYQGTALLPAHDNSSQDLGTSAVFPLQVSGTVTLLHLTPAPGVTASPVCVPTDAVSNWAAGEGALLTNPLSSNSSWSAATTPDTSIPDELPPGVSITSDTQQAHLPVGGAPTQWTIAVWEKTALSSAQMATFLHVTGAPGAKLRTYDLTNDVPTHAQVSGYGVTKPGQTGTEMHGLALPGQWHLLALTNNGSIASLSVDGIPQGTGPSTTSPALTGIDVGALTAGFRGSLGELAVFPTALSTNSLITLATMPDAQCASSPSASPSSPAPSTSTAPATSNPTTSTAPTTPTPSISTPQGTPTPTTSTAPITSTPTTSTAPTTPTPSISTPRGTPTPSTSTPDGTPTPSGSSSPPGPGQAPVRLSVLGPPRATYRSAQVIRGRLTLRANGAPIRGAPVQLFARPAGELSFGFVGTARSAPDGAVRLTVRPKVNTAYEWRYAGGTATDAASSGTHRLAVAPRIAVRLHRAAHGLHIRGRVISSHAPGYALVQRRAKGVWRTVRRVRLHLIHRGVGSPWRLHTRVVRRGNGPRIYRLLCPSTMYTAAASTRIRRTRM